MQKTTDYKLRRGTREDVFEITLLAREAYSEDFIDKEAFTFSSKKIGNLVLDVVDNKGFLVIVLQDGDELVGYFFGVIQESYFAIESQAACMSWFIRPEHRSLRNALTLLKEYEAWGKEQGATLINMTNVKLGSSKVFEKLGYTPSEMTFVKRVK